MYIIYNVQMAAVRCAINRIDSAVSASCSCVGLLGRDGVVQFDCGLGVRERLTVMAVVELYIAIYQTCDSGRIVYTLFDSRTFMILVYYILNRYIGLLIRSSHIIIIIIRHSTRYRHIVAQSAGYFRCAQP